MKSFATAIARRYRIERELGAGGTATVCEAEDMRHHRRVAVKILRPDIAAAVGAPRFLKEIELTASLQHANIVPLFDSGEAAGHLYYVMPLVAGESLRARMLREPGPMPARETIAILRDVARALAYAHERGIVHRDIKPENVLLSGGAALVADFGIAKAIDASRRPSHDHFTTAGAAIGTPGYMAPEQALGGEVDARADVYAWGVLAYELLTGKHPFASADTAQRLVAAHISQVPPPIRPRPCVPMAVVRLAMRALQKDPDMRPASGTALLDSLDADGAERAPLTSRAPFLRNRRAISALALCVVLTGGGSLAWYGRSTAAALPREPLDATQHHRRALGLLRLADDGRMRPADAYAAAVREETEALGAAPSFPEALSTLAYVKALSSHEWSAAEREIRRALAERPSSAEMHQQLATIYAITKRTREAAAEADVALRLDTLSSDGWRLVAQVALIERRYDDALTLSRRAVALQPRNQRAWQVQAWASLYVFDAFVDFAAAIEGWQSTWTTRRISRAQIVSAYERGGRREILRTLIAAFPPDENVAGWMALVGDPDRSVRMLETLCEQRGANLGMAVRYQAFDVLRGTLRFGALMGRMRLEP